MLNLRSYSNAKYVLFGDFVFNLCTSHMRYTFFMLANHYFAEQPSRVYTYYMYTYIRDQWLAMCSHTRAI